MPLTRIDSIDGRTVTLSIEGRFDFSLYQAFREATEDLEGQPVDVVVDLAETRYIDSSGLGMLLVLRKHSPRGSGDIRIVNASDHVRRVMEIANFQRIFDVA